MNFTNPTIDENVKKLTDKVLIEQTDFLVSEERQRTILILRHLREIEIRRLYIDLGFSSMYEYCIKRLKYSEGQTQRRLSSARLLTELPEIENKIESGELNVTSLSKIQSFLKVEESAENELSREEKLELIEYLENKSTREIQKDLVRFSNKPALMAEKFHITASTPVLGEELVTFTKFEALLDDKTLNLLTEFKNLYAHELSDFSDGAVLTHLLEKAVHQKKKKLGLTEKSETTPNAPLPSASEVNPTPPAETPKPQPLRTNTPIKTQRQLWARAHSCCEHRDPSSGIRCGSKHALEIDHIMPVALGGGDELDNLQLLCRNHNSRRAIKTFGLRHHSG